MKKVLFFIESLNGGGAERALAQIVENIDKTKYDITVFSETDEEVYTQRIKNVCRHKCFAKKSKHRIKKFINMIIFKFCADAPPALVKRLFIGNKFDIEVAFIEGYATRLIANSSNKKAKKIAWLHSDVINFPWSDCFYKDLNDEIENYKKFDTICCVSKTVKESADKKFGLNTTEIFYNPVDVKMILEKSAVELNDMPAKSIRIITAGRLTQVKRFDRLIRIAAKLKNLGYDFELLILGSGEEYDNLKQLIEEQNVSDCVFLKGFISNPFNYIRSSDFYVCSSQAEGFSSIATECIVLGKPVITTDCSGMSEAFAGYDCGIICDNNEDALTETIIKVLSDRSLIDYYSENCKKRAELFSLENSVKCIEELFDSD